MGSKQHTLTTGTTLSQCKCRQQNSIGLTHAALNVITPFPLFFLPPFTLLLFALFPNLFTSHSLPNSFKPIKPHLSHFFRSHTNLQVCTDLPHLAFTFLSTTNIWLQIFTFTMPLYFLMVFCNFIILSDNQHFHYLCPDRFFSKRSQLHWPNVEASTRKGKPQQAYY